MTGDAMSDEDVAATMVATFVDEWVRAGLTDVMVCPGSRSTPMTLGVLGDRRLRTHVHVDERSAAFTALGLGLATGRPAPVVTTSGTAAVELHPAVVEAHHAAVPMIVCTADRPPELQGIGAPQTIRQPGLYGSAVRLALELDPPSVDDVAQWRSWAAQTVLAATGPPPGPVHCNMAFREPLVGRTHALPAGRNAGEPWHRPEAVDAAVDLAPLVSALEQAGRGVVVAGQGCSGDASIIDLAAQLGWPVLADPTSGLRCDPTAVVAAFDPLLRHEPFAAEVLPDVVLQFGAAPASKVLQQWLDRGSVRRLVVGIGPELPRPGRDAVIVVQAGPGPVAAQLLDLLAARRPDESLARWHVADSAAQAVYGEQLSGSLTEPAVARAVVAAAPGRATLVVSSSMPVRDVEWFGPHRSGLSVRANRGANGIDGIVSTAVGVALSGCPTVALLGDLAFLHDSNGLLGAAARDIDLTVVVVDNDGGGIFSFLPQAELLDGGDFEQVFGTPHGLDLVAVSRAFGVSAERVSTPEVLRDAIAEPSGVAVKVVASDRVANVAEHEALHRAVADAIDRA